MLHRIASISAVICVLAACATGGAYLYYSTNETAFERSGREYYNCLVALYHHSAFTTYEETGTPQLERAAVEGACALLEAPLRSAVQNMPGYSRQSEVDRLIQYYKDMMYWAAKTVIIDDKELSSDDVYEFRRSRFDFSYLISANYPSARFGDPNARNNLTITFSPVSCGYSGRLLGESMRHLRSMASGGDLRVELVPFPRNDLDISIAALTLCSGSSNMAELMTEIAAVGPDIGGERSAEQVVDELRSRGIQIPSVNQCAEYRNLRKQVAAQALRFLSGYEISFSPTAIWNGSRLPPDTSSWQELERRMITY